MFSSLVASKSEQYKPEQERQMDKSRLPNFYKYSVSERLRLLYERQVISEDSYHTLMDGVATLDVNSADRMIENVVGVFGLPMGLGLKFRHQ